MNPVIDAIRSRRTVKKMDPGRPVPKEHLEAVIEAATWAPNHHSTEPWRFVVVEGGARARLGEALAAALSRSANAAIAPERLEAEKSKPLSSPVVVALISRPSHGENVVPQEEVVAAGAALQNMLLAAHSLGLASFVRTGVHAYGEEVRAYFGIAEGEALVGMVYLGYSSGPLPPGKRTPASERVAWLKE